MRRLNPGLPEQAYEKAIEKITAESSYQSLAEINLEKYNYFRDGVPVDYRNQKGELVKEKKLRVFDFDEPEKNQFLAVRQMWIQGRLHLRRPDIIGFVNGIPLLFVELKAAHRNLKTAYDDNLTDYKDTIPQLFHYNAFIILSNGIESKIGAITSRYQHFHEWKRIHEDQKGIISLDTILQGTCERNRFMDLFENFILFDNSIGKTIKLIARNHQFLGVNKAIVSVEDKKAREGKLGVFWHTQGSGKSYSMVFFCQKIHRKMKGSFTFLIVTDRRELDKQIYGTFAGVGAVTSKKIRAEDGGHLKKLLTEDHRYIFTLIHKFGNEKDENYPELTQRDDIIVISDEAHRTQQGRLALNMRNALPKASYLGFTGTPLFKDDEITKRIFGDYVSVYDFKRSIEDGATVPLYYENRGEYLKLKNPKINEQIRLAIEEADLDTDQQAKLEELFNREYPVLTSHYRLDAIAKDLVHHFNTRGYKGKAMLVCLDKLTAVKMYNLVTAHWTEYVNQFEKQLTKVKDEMELLEKHRDLQWMKETEIAVVVSSEQNEIKKFRDWDLDIVPHREKMTTRDLETEFKDEDHPFRLAIVCAMWITGFDVPSLSTLYLDKPLQSHTLMQTIARANRVHEGKNNGLIVDYIESYKSLLDALSLYAIGGSGGGGGKEGGGGIDVPVKPKEELITELEEVINATKEFLLELSFELNELIAAKGLEKIAAIAKGTDAVYTNDETRKKFEVMAREVFKKYKAVLPDPVINKYTPEKEAIDVIYTRIQDNRDKADITEVMKKIQGVVDDSVATITVVLEPTEDYGKIVDLSGIDFVKLEKNFLKSQQKNTTVQLLKDKIEAKLRDMVAKNSLRVDFYKKYNEIIDEYNRGKDAVTVEETFKKLVDFVNSLSNEQKRVVREDLTEEQMAIFDLLIKPSLKPAEKKKVKEVAIELLKALKKEKLHVEKWNEKTQISAAVHQYINDYLFEYLPYPTYENHEIDLRTNLVYNHIRSKYPGGGSSIYGNY